jgi:Zn-dependent M16 (insulinase) family peptidase
MSNLPESTLKTGDRLHGFTVTDISPLEEIRALGIQLTHEKSGARLLHLLADDQENLFSVAFRTPPPDDTGLPHILEHTVLCGSKKYPVKDPFVELLKTSMATFLNAMTYPDKTVYPCASMNETDFRNIMGVYCDAAFKPLITENHFKQEGHHLEFAEPEDTASPLVVNGIVYNEMRGNYSDLDGIIQRDTSASIFPDNAYGLDSGGDPDHIPELTYQQFVNFHQTYYHPSNSYFFIYGDIDTEKHLQFLNDNYLSSFDRIELDTGIDAQPRWDAPREQTVPYPVGPNDQTDRKTAVVATFLTNDIGDAITTLGMEVLDYYLLGNSASPLRKALIDSKLGEDLADSGYAAHQRDTFFTIGLKGTEADKAGAIMALIFDTCRKLAANGLDREKLESAFHRMELSSREIASMYPLRLMGRVYNNWIYDGDPLHLLRLGKQLAELRKKYENEPKFFENLLRKMLVDNRHYTVITFVPDPRFAPKAEAAQAEKMAALKSSLNAEKLELIKAEAATLQQMQSAPNTPEALATLPRLQLSDVPPEPHKLPTTLEKISGQDFLYTDLVSGGVNYLRLAFDLSDVNAELADYLSLYAEVLGKMGAGGLDYAQMAEKEASLTGGFSAAVSSGGKIGAPDDLNAYLIVGSKALDAKLGGMLEVIHDRLLKCDFDDRDRLKDIILQARVQLHASILPNGNQYASLYAARNLSANCALAEITSGVSQIRFIDRLAADFDNRHGQIVEKLKTIHRFVLARSRVTASFLGGDTQKTSVKNWLESFLGSLSSDKIGAVSFPFAPAATLREGVATAADVAFVAQATRSLEATHPNSPALMLLGLQLTMGFLWNEIRVKGGAYGARAGYNPADGIFAFSSYRDPAVARTLATYGKVFAHLEKEMDLSPAAVEQYIIGTVKNLDKPIRPTEAASVALLRHLRGETDGFRADFRRRLLNLNGEIIAKTGHDILAPQFANAAVAVVSGREKLEKANTELGDKPLTIGDL